MIGRRDGRRTIRTSRKPPSRVPPASRRSRTCLQERIARQETSWNDRLVVSATLDPAGRRVVLTEERWRHIKRRHPELSRNVREIMAAVRDPAAQRQGRNEREEFFFAEWQGHLPWLQVVVHYEGDEGWIATSFRLKRLPPR